jgi:hypothetical protein
MSNQYIIKFSNNVYEEFVNGYAEISKTNFDIPYLNIRTHENKNDKMNKVLFHRFITNYSTFGEVNFCDTDLKFTITIFDTMHKIHFDKNSSSAFSDFKTKLCSLLESKFETEYYPSGNVYYAGEVLYTKKGDGALKIEAHGQGIVYYDQPGLKIKYSGEFENGFFDGVGVFFNIDGTISLKANNICNGIPTQKGKLEVNFKTRKETVNIDFFTVFDEIDINNNNSKIKFVMSDEFLEILTESVCKFDNTSLEELKFNEETSEEKITRIYKLLWEIKQQQNIQQHEFVEIIKYNRYNIIGLNIMIILFAMFINYRIFHRNFYNTPK